ncbi:hypothetical protein KCU85_g491, partial [Aureobasidium melanogenum]
MTLGDRLCRVRCREGGLRWQQLLRQDDQSHPFRQWAGLWMCECWGDWDSAPSAARFASNFKESVQSIETFCLSSDVCVGDSALPDVGVGYEVLDEGVARLRRLEFFCSSFITLLAHLPVLVDKACLNAVGSRSSGRAAVNRVRDVILVRRRSWSSRHGNWCSGRGISLSQARQQQQTDRPKPKAKFAPKLATSPFYSIQAPSPPPQVAGPPLLPASPTSVTAASHFRERVVMRNHHNVQSLDSATG